MPIDFNFLFSFIKVVFYTTFMSMFTYNGSKRQNKTQSKGECYYVIYNVESNQKLIDVY